MLLRGADPFSAQVNDLRLGLEIAVIHRVAQRLTHMLMWRDPLSERVHLGKAAFLRLGLVAVLQEGGRRAGQWFGVGPRRAQDA